MLQGAKRAKILKTNGIVSTANISWYGYAANSVCSNIAMKPSSGEINKPTEIPDITEKVDIIGEKDNDG